MLSRTLHFRGYVVGSSAQVKTLNKIIAIGANRKTRHITKHLIVSNLKIKFNYTLVQVHREKYAETSF